MVWSLKETLEFERGFSKLPFDVRCKFQKQIIKLVENPYALGKPLGYPWFRELKNDKFGVYYLIYDQQVLVLFVGVSDKKNQQEVINVVKENLSSFKEFVKNDGKQI